MTSQMARLSIGNPSDINRTTGSWGVHSTTKDFKNLSLNNRTIVYITERTTVKNDFIDSVMSLDSLEVVEV